MSAVAGLMNLASATANELVGEFQETIFIRNTKGMNVGTTLFGLLARLDNEPADNVEFNWFERDPVRKIVYSSAAAADTTTTTLSFDDDGGNPVSRLLNAGMISPSSSVWLCALRLPIQNRDSTGSSRTLTADFTDNTDTEQLNPD